MPTSFTIDQVSWHSNARGNPETREHINARFWAVVSFLQRSGLTTRTLASDPGQISDAFAIQSDDLTPVGLELMKKVYEKWLTKVDEGLDPNDVTLFERQLAKLAD